MISKFISAKRNEKKNNGKNESSLKRGDYKNIHQCEQIFNFRKKTLQTIFDEFAKYAK